MIDLTRAREQRDLIIATINKKDPSFPIARLLELDGQVRELNQVIEKLRQERNGLAKQGQHGVTHDLRERSVALGQQLKQHEDKLAEISVEYKNLSLSCPNMILDDVPFGNKESNQVVKSVGEKPVFAFDPLNHVVLNEKSRWFSFELGAQMASSNFVLYQHEGARLVYSLALFMLNNNVRHGYQVVMPPYVINEQALINASNFPRFKDNVYAVSDDDIYLTPTAEVNLTNIFAQQLYSVEALPIRSTAWTSCFRREAGTYGAQERGLIRIHQFEKVELYTVCTPESAASEQERMIACAESILQQLGLHYRISLLAAQDCSFASAKTYDIEVWMPGQKAYYEVSSISNCTDFQARRAGIRYRREVGAKSEFVYTLNASSLALPRLMVALMETYQQADGSILLPDVLKSVSVSF